MCVCVWGGIRVYKDSPLTHNGLDYSSHNVPFPLTIHSPASGQDPGGGGDTYI